MTGWGERPEQTERDVEEIGRRREIPPDEPYSHASDDPDDPSVTEECDHETTRLQRVYQECREVCCRCGAILRTEIVP